MQQVIVMSHNYPSLQLTAGTCKGMVWRRSFPFGAKGLFSGVNSLLVSGSVWHSNLLIGSWQDPKVVKYVLIAMQLPNIFFIKKKKTAKKQGDTLPSFIYSWNLAIWKPCQETTPIVVPDQTGECGAAKCPLSTRMASKSLETYLDSWLRSRKSCVDVHTSKWRLTPFTFWKPSSEQTWTLKKNAVVFKKTPRTTCIYHKNQPFMDR